MHRHYEPVSSTNSSNFGRILGDRYAIVFCALTGSMFAGAEVLLILLEFSRKSKQSQSVSPAIYADSIVFALSQRS